jgi:hypothetical protein
MKGAFRTISGSRQLFLEWKGQVRLPRLSPIRLAAAGMVLLLVAATSLTFDLLNPQHARAQHLLDVEVQVGTSFSPQRAEALGLDYQQAFLQLEALHFRVIRISAYWDEVQQGGYGSLDWLLTEAHRSRQPVVLSIGLKGLGWPEFYIPAEYDVAHHVPDGGDVSQDVDVREAALAFTVDTVRRYRDNPAVVAWQVENEPMNPSGPHHWYVGKSLLLPEIAAVRGLDPARRPIIVNAFSHFNFFFDRASDRQGLSLGSLLGFDSSSAEAQSLSVLRPGDILGLDVYRSIGYQVLGTSHISTADGDWADKAAAWHDRARRLGVQTWITEAQAEPWEASSATYANPQSIRPADIGSTFSSLKDSGFTTILLWGSEYWLWRADHGDQRWLHSVQRILQGEQHAPGLALAHIPA